MYHGWVDLSPAFVAKLLESVVDSGLHRPEADDPTLPDSRRIPLFRQSGEGKVRRDPASIAEDCRRLVATRSDRLRLADGSVPDAEHLIGMERLLARKESSYTPGHFLSLVRLSQDLTDTATTGITAVERRTLHLLERRLADMQRSERPANPHWVASWLSSVRSGDSNRQCALLDLMRYLDEVSGHPLVGFPQQAASDSIHLLLAIQHFSARTSFDSRSAVPLDICLGARCILANSKVLHLRLGALLDQVLSPELALWEKLQDWSKSIEHQKSSIFRLPPEMLDPAFAVEHKRIGPLDLVLSVGERLDRPGRTMSVIESLVALERTLYRRIYRQESRKHHNVVLLRRVLDRALNEKNRRSMRLTPSKIRPAQNLNVAISESDSALPWGEGVWAKLRDQGDALESARDQGCTPSTRKVWNLFFQGLEPRGEELSDLDEYLRWSLDCRGNLLEAVEDRTIQERDCLRDWFLALVVRAMAIQPARKGKSFFRRHQRDQASPLLWLVAARKFGSGATPQLLVTESVQNKRLVELDKAVCAALEDWCGSHPWDRRLFGIWPADLRGPCFADGIRPGLRRSRVDGTPSHEVEVRLEMLNRELEYRSWLGARERVALLERTLDPNP